jgi:hypothetical protein
MNEHYIMSQQRPRENRPAAYFNTNMFYEPDAFLSHLQENGPAKLLSALQKEGFPLLYRHP